MQFYGVRYDLTIFSEQLDLSVWSIKYKVGLKYIPPLIIGVVECNYITSRR